MENGDKWHSEFGFCNASDFESKVKDLIKKGRKFRNGTVDVAVKDGDFSFRYTAHFHSYTEQLKS